MRFSILLLLTVFFSNCYAGSNTDQLIKASHEYGITGCDHVIKKAINLETSDNWKWTIGRHQGGLPGSTTEVTYTFTWGVENDSLLEQFTVIQTKSNCYIDRRTMLTFTGSCESNVDKDNWYLDEKQNGTDFSWYKNRYDLVQLTKDIKVGNFQACVVFYPEIRDRSPRK